MHNNVKRERVIVPDDKSLFFYGWGYHKLFDKQNLKARELIVDLVPEEVSVLDIACGTGELCFALREKKNCRVIGVDISLRMLRFAEKSNPYDEVTFIHGDATDLGDFEDGSFDYATMLVLMHELTEENQTRVFHEALRVARKVILVDSKSPLPRNFFGLGIRLVEATFGHDHNRNFKNFLKNGGIDGVLRHSLLPLSLESQSVFGSNCREIVIVSR
jgi:ubiquinone/menaquinone biosynthesis C-methylase UbiE